MTSTADGSADEEKNTVQKATNVPLTSHQKEVWLAGQASAVGEADLRTVFRVEAKLCPDRLRTALALVLRQFPLLRARLHLQGSEPHFELEAYPEVELEIATLAQGGSAAGHVDRWIHEFLEKPLGPRPLRCALVHLGKTESLYVIKTSHLVMDGIGMAFHADLLAEAYAALARGEVPVFGEPCAADELYLEDQKHATSPRFTRDLEWWRSHLETISGGRIFRARPGFPDVLNQSRHKKYSLSEETTRKIQSVLEKGRIGPTTYFTALHALIVSFMCNERAIVVRTPLSFGERKVLTRRQGSQVTLPPMPLDLGRYRTFTELVEEVATQSRNISRHIYTPYQVAVRQLDVTRFAHIADTFVHFIPHTPGGSERFPIHYFEQMHSPREEVLFGVMVMVERDSGRFSLTVRSSCNHLTETDVERYVERVATVSAQLAESFELGSLDYLLDEEKDELRRWQQGERKPYPSGTIPALFDAIAAHHAERPAAQDEAGRVWTYAELARRSRVCAAWLAAQGVGKGAVVGVLAHRGLGLLETLLGIMRVGAIYLPLDPQSPAERMEHIVRDAQAALTIDPEKVDYAAASPASAQPEPETSDGAYLIYTSGSTGRPKGVLVPHCGFVNMIQGQIEVFGLTPDDHVLQFASPAFDASLSEIFMALLSGACLYPVSDRYRHEPWTLRTYLQEHAVTVTTFPPSYLHLFDRERFASLRVLITAGESPITEEALHYARQLAYFNAYGPTETCVCASMKRVTPDDQPPISAGRVIPNATAFILDAQKRPLPAGMTGELHIGGASLACGYYRNDALTAVRFLTLPTGERVYATGDLALWSPHGEIVLQGRTDDQVKIRGNRVEPGEVSFLLEKDEAVRQAFVLVADDQGGKPMLAAFLVLASGTRLDEVVERSRGKLPGYMIPGFWHALTAMPVSVTGKIDRNALRAILKRETAAAASRAAAVDPDLLAFVESTLGRKYDPAADFFAQGGDSLSAMALLHALSARYGVEIPFRRFIQCADLRELATLLQPARPAPAAPLCDEAPLSRNQFQLWAYQQANHGTIDYNMPYLIEVGGARAERFLEGLRRAVLDQPLLRCTVAGEIDTPCFRATAPALPPLPIVGFDTEAAAQAHFDRLVHTSFDLRTEPPLRLAGARIGTRLQVLVLLHHLAGDGETLALLLRNALRYARGQDGVAGRLATQAAFCARESDYLRSADCEHDREHWEKILAAPPPRLHPAQSKRQGAMAVVPLDPALVAALEALCKQAGTTVLAGFAALLGAFLRRHHGRPELLIALPVGLRETQEEFATAGYFVNTVALRLRESDGETTLARVREAGRQLKAALPHSRYGTAQVMADVLATHSQLADIEEDGLFVRSVELRLAASKLSASFTLETGARPRLVLEHDAGFIPSGTPLLDELKQFLAAACGECAARSRADVLADAWREILRTEAAAGGDFFQAGGDSIKAIQIAGILHRNGITSLSAADIFQRPGFAELCGLLEAQGHSSSGAHVSLSPPAPGQHIPLLPLQAALVRRHPAHWKCFHMLLPLEVGPELPTEKIEAWVRSLSARYEALRLVFSEAGARLLPEPPPLALKRVLFDSDATETAALRRTFKLLAAGLDPTNGRTFDAALAERGDQRLLVLAGHHLVLDALSLDLLRRDLLQFCTEGTPATERHGIATRARALAQLAETGNFPTPEDRHFWRSVCGTPAGRLHALQPGTRDRAADRVFATRSLAGLGDTTAAGAGALLAALSRALHDCGQRDAVFVTLESHGRDSLLAGFDASRSLGWFTSVCPLPLTPSASLAQTHTHLEAWMQEHFGPRHGQAFGYLQLTQPETFTYDGQIGFNFFGTHLADADRRLQPRLDSALPGAIPELLHPDFEPDCPLDLVGYFDAAGTLQLGAYFSPKVLPADWVAGLLDRWIEALRTLPAYTPPVPSELRQQLAELAGCSPTEIEGIRPPDAAQEAMLFQNLAQGGATYTQQIEFTLEGDADEFRLMKAWSEVVSRHESLRSLFPSPHPGEFHRVVLRQPRTGTEYHDLSRLPAALATERTNALLVAERKRGFDLGQGPLLRAQFFRLAPRRLMISWCFHHVLMDGWCVGILLRELFSHYRWLAGDDRSRSAPLPPPVGLADYAHWRARFDESAAKSYWQSLLHGYQPVPVFARAGAGSADADPATLELRVEGGLAAQLASFAQAHTVTLPILLQSLWAVLLGSEGGARRDVVFGVVTSGRPAELPGIERTVGLFIQTLPVRVRWAAGDSIAAVLAAIKAQSIAQMRHGYLPLPVIGRDLFDHLLVFENYPYETVFDGGALKITDVRGFEKIPYPLGLSVVTHEGILFRFLFDPTVLPRARVETLRAKLLVLLETVVTPAAAGCHELEGALSGAGFGSAKPAGDPGAPMAAPRAAHTTPADNNTAPSTVGSDLEAVLLPIYASVLECEIPSVDADFFRLGGHSLLAMRLIARISRQLSLKLTIEDVMRHSSVRKLARFMRGAATATHPLAPTGPVKERLPLSSAQMRLWFLQRLHEDRRVNVIPFAARLPGPLDRAALQQALTLLEQRHDALRLRVSATEPEQRLVPPGQLRLDYVEGPFDREAFVGGGLAFGFENPLVRVALHRDSDNAFVFAFCAHHIVFDGWSAEIFLRELNQAYAAVTAGTPPAWAPLEVGYMHYVEWTAQQGTPGLEALKQSLLPLPEPLRLPLDFARPALQSFAGRVHAFRLSAEQSAGLKRLAADLDATLFPVLLALCDTLLYRHTGQSDLIVGCPAANRELEQTHSMLGLFVNTLAVRTTLQPDRSFAALVADVQAVFQTALTHQACPFDWLIDSLQVARTPSRNPLFDVFVALEGAEWSHFGQAPLHLEPLPLPHDRSKFDLSFYFKETESGIFDVHLEYCTALFREETIQRIGHRLVRLLDAVLERTDTPLSALPFIPADELRTLATFNATAEDFAIERDADLCFREQLGRTPQVVAVVEPSGAACTYAEFDQLVAGLTGWLRDQGVAPGDFVGVCFERSLDLMVAIFAVFRAGATYVPLSPTLPEARFRAISEDLGRCTIVCAPALSGHFATLGQPLLVPDIRRLSARDVPPAAIDPGAVAYTIFTSGSTGRPKGALIEHRSLVNRLLWMQSRFPIGEGDVVLQKTTISFDVSVWELVWWSWTGAALAMLAPDAEKDPRKIAEAVHAHRVTVLHFVPSMLRAFLEYLELYPETREQLSSLRYVFVSGEALPRELVLRFQALLSAQLHNLYGPTEAAIDVTWYPCLHAPGDVIPIGRPVSNTQIRILDEHLQEVPLGVVGELYIGGVQVGRGYVNRAALSAERFLSDPFVAGGRLYRTGDLGRWLPDGNIEYLGRNDDQVKVRGFRIELGEVEAALSRCSGVSQAVACVRNVAGYDSLEAFLLPHPGATLSAAAIQSELSALLPAYMCPGLLQVVDEIPVSASGKADRRRLTGRPLSPQREGIKAAGALQQEIAHLWTEVIPELQDPDIDRGFFESGGNSLLLIRLHALLEAKWPGVFSIATLFAESTIAAQAALLERTGVVRPGAGRAEATQSAPVAIVGLAIRLGDYEDLEPFWTDLAAAADKNIPLPENRRRELRQVFEAVGLGFDETRLREAAFLSDVSGFDHKRFGLSPNDASLIDPQQRLFLDTALRALDDAGCGGAALQDEKVGVFVGASPTRLFQDALTRSFPEQAEQIYLLNVPSNVVARISYLKNWSGPAATVDTACSSSLTALHDACESLRAGTCRVAVVGAAHVIPVPVRSEQSFTIESGSGRTRTFDAKADGVGGGEGAAVFILKRLDQARQDNDCIHALIAGSALNQDGRSSSMAAPNPAAQAEVIRLAAGRAAIPLARLDFFEAHGTATALGDPIEIEGLTRAFRAEPPGAAREQKAPIGSIKGNIGHLDAAAGALGLAKAVMTLKQGAVPPQPHFERPNPHIDFATAPVRVAQALEPLPAQSRPWHGGVSSFGLSGVNAHVVLREAPARTLPADESGWCCVPLSAGDEAGLRAYAARLHDAVTRNADWPLHAIAATLAAGREHLEFRAAFVASSRAELLQLLGVPITIGRVAKPLAEPTAATVFPSREDAAHCAEAFLRGHTPAWTKDRPLHRLHLPATPMLRKPLWPRFHARFLSAPLHTPEGTAWSLAIDKPDFWPVSEHRLNQTPTLVGMAAIELIVTAAGTSQITIENLAWHRPVTFEAGNRATLRLKPEGDAMLAVELHHARESQWQVALSAKVRLGQPEPRGDLDPGALRAALRPFEVAGGQTLVSVSERWNCRRALWISEQEDRLLAHLMLPDAFKADLHAYRWHPAMLDLAASLALHGTAGFVPARCGRIALHRPLPAEVFASVTITERKPQRITADCVVTDKSGQVLLELNGLLFLAFSSRAAEAPGGEPRLYELTWTSLEVPPTAVAAPRTLLLLGHETHPLHAALVGQATLRRALPRELAERKQLAREIVDHRVTHVVCLSSADWPHWSLASLLQEVGRARLRAPLHLTFIGSGALAQPDPQSPDALALGLLRSLPQEEPLLTCAYVEVESGSPAATAALRTNLGRFRGGCLIGSDGGLRVQTAVPLTAAAAPAPIIDGCVVISGGLGGMGLTLARQFTENTRAKVVLLHRQTAGAEVPFANYCCDVNDSARVHAVFAEIRREHGPIKGIVHAAGLPGDGYLATKEQAVYERVLQPKVDGTWNLHEASRGDPLEFFILASSRTALTGAPGQCDYAAANAHLNAFAAYRHRLGLPALALCWNTWAEVGMAARLGTATGGFALAPEQAWAVMRQALGYKGAQLVVALATEDVSGFRTVDFLQPALPAAGAGSESAASSPHRGFSEEAALELIRDALGYDQPLTREDDFYELGGDSIAATQVVTRVNKTFGADLGVLDLLDCSSLGEFIDRIRSATTAAAPAKTPAIAPAPAQEKYPVGREQLSILYAELLSGQHTGFNLPLFLRLPRDVDLPRLEHAIGALIGRHEVLRTTFCDFDQERPAMIVHPFRGFTLEERPLASLAEKESLIVPFDVKSGPLFRAKLLRVGPDERYLFLDIHHALADGRTMSLLNADLHALYHGRPLPAVRLQQKDIAWHQFHHPDAKAREYWQSRFQGELPTLDLPSGLRRPASHTNRGATHAFELPAALVAGIDGLARRQGVTRYIVVLAAWRLLIHAAARSEDFVIAITVDGRDEHLETAGMLAALLPLRMRRTGGMTLGEILRNVQEVSNDARRHKAYILNDLLTDLHPPISLDRTLLSEVILSYMNFEIGEHQDALFETLPYDNPASKADLSVFASDVGGKIGFFLEYYADLFTATDIRQLAADLVNVLERMVGGDASQVLEFTASRGPERGEVRRDLDPALAAQVERFAQRGGHPVENVFVAAFAALLNRVMGRPEITIDRPHRGRTVFTLDEHTEFSHLLAAARTPANGIADVARSPAPRVPSAGPGPNSVAFIHFESFAPAISGAHDLTCAVGGADGSVTVCFAFAREALPADTAANWLGYFCMFLNELTKEGSS